MFPSVFECFVMCSNVFELTSYVINLCFRMFSNVFKCFQMFPNVSKLFSNVSTVSKCFRLFSNCFRTSFHFWSWNVSTWTEMFSNVLAFSDVFGCIQMFSDWFQIYIESCWYYSRIEIKQKCVDSNCTIHVWIVHCTNLKKATTAVIIVNVWNIT